MLCIVAPDRRGTGLTAINRHRLGHAVTSDGLGQEARGRLLIPVLGEQEVNRLAGLIHRTIEVIPRAFDLDRGLIHPPALTH
jgi:hypothetical protein